MTTYKQSIQSTQRVTSRNLKFQNSIPTIEQFRTEQTLGSPLKDKNNSQLNQIKNNIQGIINAVASKTLQNTNAIEIVKNTNNQVIQTFNSPTKYRPNSFQYLIDPLQIPNVKFTSSVKPQSQKKYVHQRINNLYSPQHIKKKYDESEINKSLLAENINLKKALNEQIKKNNYLIKKVEFLEDENSRLKLTSKKSSDHFTNYSKQSNKLSSSQYNELSQEIAILKNENNKLRYDTNTLSNKIY